MDGPGHYRAAEERLRASDWQWEKGDENSDESWRQSALHEAAIAQVHATLALAAATALNDPTAGMSNDTFTHWEHAAAISGVCGDPTCKCRSEKPPAVRSLRP